MLHEDVAMVQKAFHVIALSDMNSVWCVFSNDFPKSSRVDRKKIRTQ